VRNRSESNFSYEAGGKVLFSTGISDLTAFVFSVGTLFLFGLYWLDRQSRQLCRRYGASSVSARTIVLGYVSFAVGILLLLVKHVVNGILIECAAIGSGIFMMLYFATLLYACITYLQAVCRLIGEPRYQIELILVTALFNVVFLNWWQNRLVRRAQAESGLS